MANQSQVEPDTSVDSNTPKAASAARESKRARRPYGRRASEGQKDVSWKAVSCDWQRVVVRDKDWKFTRSVVLDAVDKAYARVAERYVNEKQRPSSLRINAAFRKLFNSVTVWGERPEVIVEFDSSDDSELPSFLFVYG